MAMALSCDPLAVIRKTISGYVEPRAMGFIVGPFPLVLIPTGQGHSHISFHVAVHPQDRRLLGDVDDALDAGVRKVHIVDGRVKHALLLELFTDTGIGTEVIP